MSTHAKLPSIFEVPGAHVLNFKSPNGLKAMAFQFWVVLGIIFLLVWVVILIPSCILDGPTEAWSDFKSGALTLLIGSLPVLIPAVFFFLVWLRVKPTSCLFDRAAQVLHYTSHKHRFSMPWHQVHFKAQYFPSPSGGGSRTEFFVLGAPPFPEGLLPKDPKKLRKVMERGGGAFNFGSFSVKDGEEASRYERFLNAFMTTDQPAEALHRQIVEVAIQANQPGDRTRGLGDL